MMECRMEYTGKRMRKEEEEGRSWRGRLKRWRRRRGGGKVEGERGGKTRGVAGGVKGGRGGGL